MSQGKMPLARAQGEGRVPRFGARSVLWALWGIVLAFAPCVVYGVVWSVVIERYAAPLAYQADVTLSASDVLRFAGPGSLPICVLAFGVAYAFRGGFTRFGRGLAVAAGVATAAYGVLLGMIAWDYVSDGLLLFAPARFEWPLRHAALCLWAAVGPLWALRGSAGPGVAERNPEAAERNPEAAADPCSEADGRACSGPETAVRVGADDKPAAPSYRLNSKATGVDGHPASSEVLANLPEFSSLSQREREVLGALLSGEGVAAISRRFSLSQSSVSTYRSRALEKLGVASVDELEGSLAGAAGGAGPAGSDDVRLVLRAGEPGWSAVVAVAFSASYLLRVCVLTACAYLSHARDWSRYAATPEAYLGRAAWDVAPALVWLVLWAAVVWALSRVLARAKGQAFARPRLDRGLAVLAGAAAIQGLFLGGATATAGVSGFEGYAGPVFALGLSVAGLFLLCSCVAYPVGLLLLLRACAWSVPESPVSQGDLDERCLLYLRGRGLGELQAEVVMRVAAGYSAAAICRELHVARGTVNAYRAQAYATLEVHSRRELAELLRHDVGHEA